CYFIIPLGAIFLPWAPQFIAAIVARNLLLGELALVYLLMPGDLISKRWPNSALWQVIAAMRNLFSSGSALTAQPEHSCGIKAGISPKS
ncbi:MAG: hypothetical protein JWO59_3117, partial [Chloroflexi bacterium]|nr:hypothetical protein [Chloroflexota bacterium]